MRKLPEHKSQKTLFSHTNWTVVLVPRYESSYEQAGPHTCYQNESSSPTITTHDYYYSGTILQGLKLYVNDELHQSPQSIYISSSSYWLQNRWSLRFERLGILPYVLVIDGGKNPNSKGSCASAGRRLAEWPEDFRDLAENISCLFFFFFFLVQPSHQMAWWVYEEV